MTNIACVKLEIQWKKRKNDVFLGVLQVFNDQSILDQSRPV